MNNNRSEDGVKSIRNSMGIRKYDYVEFFVGSAKMVAYWHAKALGLDIIGYKGPETGIRDRTSYLLESKHGMRMVITSAINPGTYDVSSFVQRHGDGVKRWSMQVDSVHEFYEKALSNGAIPVRRPNIMEDKSGYIEEAAFRLYDDTELVVVNFDNFNGLFMPGFGEPVQNINIRRNETGLKQYDHIVGNVQVNDMDHWANYFIKAFDFEQHLHFGPGDIETKLSALVSRVVRSKDLKIKNPINEPLDAERMSQIEEFTQQYHGTGVQHIALETNNIINTVQSMRENGVEFLDAPPDTYYEEIAKKEFGLTESLDELKRLGILCDVEGNGYLLQLFTKPTGDRPTFFYEIIQRRNGAEGFGHGNFLALFESIERDQERRGNLTKIK
jgi:4-hydroxyphenylpyruvate dioxygenase